MAQHVSALITAAMFVVLLCLAPATALAADVEASVGSSRVYINIPFQFNIEVSDAEQIGDPPQFPDVDGLRSLGPPSESNFSFTQIINGRRTDRRGRTYTWTLVAERDGRFEIPAIRVQADGEVHETEPIVIHVTEPETGGELLAEISVDDEDGTWYLGEPIELTLRLYIAPYVEQRDDFPVSDQTMFELIRMSRSSFGPFTSAVRRRLDRPIGLRSRYVVREMDDGSEQPYFLFEFEATIRPEKAGPLELDPVVVIMQYPTRIRRDVFSYRLVDSRMVAATAEPPDIEVLGPPREGRPELFSGAVGRFNIDVTAAPTEVQVGEPITLTVEVTDRSSYGVEMDLVPPPPLHRMQALTERFHIPEEPLAGVVNGRRKTFQQTIRPRNAEVTSIPPIEYSYFDPDLREYASATSESIALNVAPSPTVHMNDVDVRDPAGQPRTGSGLVQRSGGILANASGTDLLLVDHQMELQWWHWLIFAAAPLLFVGAASLRLRHQLLAGDQKLQRRRKAATVAERAAGEARSKSTAEAADLVSMAICNYVADRAGLPRYSLTAAEAVEHLRARQVDDAVIRDVDDLLQLCEQVRYSGNGSADQQMLVDQALQCIRAMEGQRLA